jgi:hypothetical protein
VFLAAVFLDCAIAHQAQSCMFIGVWADGEFVDGKWVHQDGTTFQGSFEASVPVRAGCYGRVRQAPFAGVVRIRRCQGESVKVPVETLDDAANRQNRSANVLTACVSQICVQREGCFSFSRSGLSVEGAYSAKTGWTAVGS